MDLEEGEEDQEEGENPNIVNRNDIEIEQDDKAAPEDSSSPRSGERKRRRPAQETEEKETIQSRVYRNAARTSRGFPPLQGREYETRRTRTAKH